ncbi:winged helix-turn-helix domain-containing protein [Pelagibacterium limicola]|uniref:winged helix-turn-helix domain-containing protein n=1 Tax=Pelagibacterium limicola TaxID=2791022 RepID=UPI001A9AD6C8|nr:crosslink repair DNA glycosylase YcaQ family protein [Pelagibacterium limicola]
MRRLAIASQGLVPQPPFGDGLEGTRRAIEHLGYVQIDTLAVVERAHHHVLWCRVPGYASTHLNALIGERQIFEYWFHAASYLPTRDYRFALPQMQAIRKGEHPYFSDVDKRLMKEILARVRAEGPLGVRDVETDKNGKGSWWNWGPGRKALDKLFMQGDLMICARNGMEKTYDLAERCLPDGLDLRAPSLPEYAAYLFDTMRRAHGVFTWKQLVHLKKGKPLRDAMREVLEDRVAAGVVQPVNGAGAGAYVDVEALERSADIEGRVRVLSPFDNLVIHRDRLSALFGFDYRIECYVPAPKRQFGYFCLPVLYGDRFVARIDCKAHRAEKRFEVLSFHLEEGPLDLEQFFPAFRDALQRFADYNMCPHLDDRAVAKVRKSLAGRRRA